MIDITDILYGNLIREYRDRVTQRLTREPANAFWTRYPIVSYESAQEMAGVHIDNKQPFCAARLGSVELKILLWAKKIPRLGACGIKMPVFYSDTYAGAKNAGIRPRSRPSYHRFADIFYDSMQWIDLMSSWQTSLEHSVLQSTQLRPLVCDGEILCPTLGNNENWAHFLNKKRVLVISPFKKTIERQIQRLGKIWPNLDNSWNVSFEVKQFPYLIDEKCKLHWEDVYHEMKNFIENGNFDVVLLGCGGLGMPLSVIAKKAGAIGIHLGGHLQILFGIYGQRHLDHEWHMKWINDSWTRPLLEETPASPGSVEGGCYW